MGLPLLSARREVILGLNPRVTICDVHRGVITRMDPRFYSLLWCVAVYYILHPPSSPSVHPHYPIKAESTVT